MILSIRGFFRTLVAVCLHCTPVLLAFLFSLQVGFVNAQGAETPAAQATTQKPEEYRKAVETFYKLDQSNNFTESRAYAGMYVLPMGIKKNHSNI